MHKHSVGRGHLLSEVMCVCLSALLFFLSCPVTFHELIFNYLSLSNLLRQNSCVSDQIKLVDHLWQRQRCLGEQGGGVVLETEKTQQPEVIRFSSILCAESLTHLV